LLEDSRKLSAGGAGTVGVGDGEESESFTSSSKATDFARPFFSGLPSPSWNGFDGNLAGSDCRLLVALVGGVGTVSFGMRVFEGLLTVEEVLRARTGTGGGTFTGAVGSKGVATRVSFAYAVENSELTRDEDQCQIHLVRI
jgi:hypothetical protein